MDRPVPPHASPLAIGIAGATGRFGTSLAAAAQERGWNVCWRRDRSGIAAFAVPAVLFDCSSPEAVPQTIEAALAFRAPLVIATSGDDWTQHPLVRAAATQIPVLVTGNLCRAHGLMVSMARLADGAAAAGARVTVIDRQPAGTRDMPGSTALQLAVASGTQRIVGVRSGAAGADHQVVLVWEGETLEINHRVTSLAAPVQGALAALERAAALTRPGLYGPGVEPMRSAEECGA